MCPFLEGRFIRSQSEQFLKALIGWNADPPKSHFILNM